VIFVSRAMVHSADAPERAPDAAFSRRTVAANPLTWLGLSVVLHAVAAGPVFAEAQPQRNAQGEVIERVVAVVNGEPLLLSELRTRAAPFLPRLMQAPELQRMTLMEQLYGELLNQIIDERLLEQEARKLSVSITSSDVDRAIENVQRQSGLSEPDFWEAVRGQGFVVEQYKADVRRQLLRLKVVNQKVRTRVNITEDDVRRKYDEQLRSARAAAQFHVAHVFVPVEESTATQLAAARERAEQVRGSLTPETFDAKMNDVGGGDLGWVRQSDLPDSLAQALVALEPGQISAPVRGPSGYHIFLLRERREGDQAIGSYDQVKNEIYREMLDQSMAKQEVAYLAELRKQSLISRRL
jgi:peptidyl-prolyl cis-trans isomerase SurA